MSQPFFKFSVFFKFLLSVVLFTVILLNAPLANAQFDDEFGGEEAFFKVEEQIVVSASKRAQKLSDAPVAISVITADDIKMYGAQSIAEVLRMVPGVYVQETTGGQQDVSIRGMSNGPKQAGAFASYSRNILVMIDGRSYFNDVFGGTFWEFLPITVDDIDRIEVVRGPASALFGANAVTGVVNIITKDFKKTDGFYVSSGIALNALKASKLDDKKFGNLTTIRYGNEGEKFSYRIGAEYSKKTAFDNLSYDHSIQQYKFRQSVLAGSGNVNPDYKSIEKNAIDAYKISNFYKYNINNDNVITLQLGRSKGEANFTGTSGDLLLVKYENVENNIVKLNYQYKDLKISLSNNWGKLGDDIKSLDVLEIKIDKYTGDTFTEILDGENQDGMSWNSFDIDIQNVFTISDNNILVGGINWRKSESQSDDVYFRDRQKKSQKFIAGFVNNEYKFSDELKFILGARYDKFDTPDKDRLSPQSILFYKPKENQTFRLIYSQAIRAPFIADLFTNAQFSDGITADGKLAPIIRLRPNEQLNPMTIQSYEFGYSTILKEKINLDMNLYHYRSKDLMGYQVTVNDSAWGVAKHLTTDAASAFDMNAVNLSGLFKSNGIELGMNYNHSKNLRFWGNASYQNSKFQDRTSKAAPEYLGSIGMFKNLKKGWNFSMSANVIGSSEVELTNIMDQTLVATLSNAGNNLLSERNANKPYSNIYNAYISKGGQAYSELNSAAILPNFNLIFAGSGLTVTDAEASFISAFTDNVTALVGYYMNIGGQDLATASTNAINYLATNDTNAALSARAGFGSALAASSQNTSVQKVDSYMFINLRLAKKVMNDNGEFSLAASLRPDRRQYAFGEKTGDKYIATFSYKF